MKLSILDVEHIAKLARLSLSDEEKKQYAVELSGIFNYIETLNEVDVSSITETRQVSGLEDVYREDIVHDTNEETKKKLIDAFPKRLGSLLQVKGVFADADTEE